MRFSSIFAIGMASFAIAAPLPAQEQQAAGFMHPAVDPLGRTTIALTNVVSEINNFKGDEFEARRLEQDAYAALQMLSNATQEILRNPDVDYLTALQFVPVAPGLIMEAYTLVNTLNDKQKDLQSTPDFAARTARVLDRTYEGVQGLVLAFDKKFPTIVTTILKGMDDDVVKKMKNVVDKFAASAPPSPYGPQVMGTAEPASYPAYPAYQQVAPAPQAAAAPKYQPYNAQIGQQGAPAWGASTPPRPQAPQGQAKPQAQPRPQTQTQTKGKGHVAQPQYAQPQYAQPSAAQPQYAQPQSAQPQYPAYPQTQSTPSGYQPAGLEQDTRNAWPQWSN